MNGPVHKAVGGAVGSSFALKYCASRGINVGFGELILVATAATLGGSLPDVLEPPISPRHRGPAHSVPVAAVVTSLVHKLMYDQGSPAGDNRSDFQNEIWPILLLSFLAGFASHLALDLTTPSGLPILFSGVGLSLHS